MTITFFNITPGQVATAKAEVERLESLVLRDQNIPVTDEVIQRQNSTINGYRATIEAWTKEFDSLAGQYANCRSQWKWSRLRQKAWMSIDSIAFLGTFFACGLILNVVLGVCTSIFFSAALTFLSALIFFCALSLALGICVGLRGPGLHERIEDYTRVLLGLESQLGSLANSLAHVSKERGKVAALLTQAIAVKLNLERLGQLRNDWLAAENLYLQLLKIVQDKKYSLIHCNWRDMRGTEFEVFLKEVFQILGYQVEQTKTTGDQGIDLIVIGKGKKIGVQAKGYSGNVGNHAVMEAHAGMRFYDCNGCMVITNSNFTRQAIELASRIGCELIGGDDLPAFIANY